MSLSNISLIFARCQRLLTDYATLLTRHQYLEKQFISFQQKLLDSEAESHEELEKQNLFLEGIEKKLKALERDKWLDKLFSVAKNEQQLEEIERYMQRWGIGRPDKGLIALLIVSCGMRTNTVMAILLDICEKRAYLIRNEPKVNWLEGLKNGCERTGSSLSKGMVKLCPTA